MTDARRESVLERVKKLLELAKSDNEHEAAAAAARAAELCLKHEIEEADLEAAKPAGEQQVHPAADETIDRDKRAVTWKIYLKMGLCSAFGGDSYTWRRTIRTLDGRQVNLGGGRQLGAGAKQIGGK